MGSKGSSLGILWAGGGGWGKGWDGRGGMKGNGRGHEEGGLAFPPVLISSLLL
jgi:hypothetical protein